MIKEVADRWVAELRSGKYKQTTGYLNVVRSENEEVPVGFCCLGVLCEIAVSDGIVDSAGEEQMDSRDGVYTFAYYGDMNSALLPYKVLHEYDMESSTVPLSAEKVGEFVELNHYAHLAHLDQMSLVDLNDAGVPFSAIANIIEKYWEEL
jgi:hypothetical protein